MVGSEFIWMSSKPHVGWVDSDVTIGKITSFQVAFMAKWSLQGHPMKLWQSAECPLFIVQFKQYMIMMMENSMYYKN